MEHIPIRSIAIDNGRLHVEPALPSGENMRFIYRAARGVQWDEASASLHPAEDSADHVAWLRRILDASKEEYGIALEITGQTVWRDVPDDILVALKGP